MLESDFQNVSGKESGNSATEGSRGGRDDSALSVGSAVLLPWLDNASSLQQSMSFKIMQEQKPKNVLFNPISSTALRHIPAVEAFESNQKAHIVHTSQNQDMDIYSASIPHVNDVKFSTILHPSMPNTMKNSFSKFHGSSSGHSPTGATVKHLPSGSDVLKNTSLVGSEVGATHPRNILKPATTSAQLTIFYAGSVIVYDDVPCDKAQNLLLMASEGCKAAENAVDSRAEATALPFPDHLSVAQTKENSNQADPSKPINASMGVVTADIILPIAVPQARKASLTRFLEKRKERASSSLPNSCDKMNLDDSFH